MSVDYPYRKNVFTSFEQKRITLLVVLLIFMDCYSILVFFWTMIFALHINTDDEKEIGEVMKAISDIIVSE